MSLFENGRHDGFDNPLRIDTRGERLAVETYRDIRDAHQGLHQNACERITNFVDNHLPLLKLEDKTPHFDIFKPGELAEWHTEGAPGRHPRFKHALRQAIQEASADGHREFGEVVKNLNDTLHKHGRHLKVTPEDGRMPTREYSIAMYDLATMEKIAAIRAERRGRI
ncbi:MAG: hypothetical protein IT342_23515 [Candidatus Melainabacteria bacterium]|nr:hypothetical protein [Candidatus Melainabacteria bacterium]